MSLDKEMKTERPIKSIEGDKKTEIRFYTTNPSQETEIYIIINRTSKNRGPYQVNTGGEKYNSHIKH